MSASCNVIIAEPGSWEMHLFWHVWSFRGGGGFGTDSWPISAFGLASVFDLIWKESVRRGHWPVSTRRVETGDWPISTQRVKTHQGDLSQCTSTFPEEVLYTQTPYSLARLDCYDCPLPNVISERLQALVDVLICSERPQTLTPIRPSFEAIKIKSPSRPKLTKIKKPPFAKSLFAGEIDPDVMTYPEVLDEDTLKALNERLLTIEDFFAKQDVEMMVQLQQSTKVVQQWIPKFVMLKLPSKTRDAPAHNIYLNEHLTASNRKKFAEARKQRDDDKFEFVWVKNGHIYIREEEGKPAVL
uniref:FP protein C-terminal domain-containing protein n=1 Tax=Timema shepardi TaxID=629360 RepID=A0A7R9APH6_TIMSH|nr:unnamed protein product [Timema shepardi]